MILVFTLATTAFAAEPEASVETVAAEEVVDVVDEAIADETVTDETATDKTVTDEVVAEAENSVVENEQTAPAEEETEQAEKHSMSGSTKTLIAAIVLLAFGGIIIFVGNSRLKNGQKTKTNKK